MKRFIIFLGLTFFACNFSFFAQEIELPDLTTVIDGTSTEELELELPDFSDVVESPADSGKIVPVLPEVEIIQNQEVVVTQDDANQRQIYAEGVIGGGYPAIFTGDFSVSKIFGDNPFKISFSHDSAAGYVGSQLSDGYNNNQTTISMDKVFSIKNITLNLNANYEDAGNGLQGKAESVSSINQDQLNGSVDFLWNLKHGFSIGSLVFSDFYYRFTELTYNPSESFDCPEWIKRTASFELNPSLFLRWDNEHISTGIAGEYSFNNRTNRGQFGADFSWTNDLIKAYGDVDFVIGDNLNGNSFLIPFDIGIQAFIPVYFADRKVKISVEGGLMSWQNKINELEKEYNFSALSFVPAESSDWYSSFSLMIPLKSSFSANLDINYRTSAFGNGIYEPLYDSAFVNGCYEYSMKERESFVTDFEITYKYKLFAVTALWHSNWLYVPVLEDKHTFDLTFSLQSKEGKWGASTGISYSIDSEDKTPYLDFEAYIQAASSVKFILSAEDICKLIMGEARSYAGEYISKSGSVTLSAKFLF